MSAQIQRRIQEMQRGKQGIYPYHVAREIAVEFQIPVPVAIDHVIHHIKATLTDEAHNGS